MSPSKITRGKKKPNPPLHHTHTHTQNPAKQVEDAWQDSFQCPAHFSKTVPHYWLRIHELRTFQKI